MNSGIIPQGPSEMLRGPATITRPVLMGEATTACVMADVVFLSQAEPANAAAINDFTLPIQGQLYNVKSMTLTSGDMIMIYRH